MQHQPIEQIQALPDRAVVYCFEGTVQKAFRRSDGTNSTGPWSIETFLLKEDSGGEIKLMLKDADPAGWAPGTKLRLEAWKGDKGFSGLYAADDEYKGEVRRILRATKTCNVTVLNGQQQAAPQQQPQHQQQPAQSQPAAQVSTHQQGMHNADVGSPPPKQQTKAAPDSVTEAKRTMMQIANLHLLSAQVVESYEAPAFKKATGQDMTESQRQGAIASIFIESCRSGLVRNMPTKALD
jgi:hypothetical protein